MKRVYGHDILVTLIDDNEVIPQTAELPTLKANLKHLELRAQTRRIAVYYSQISA